MLVGVQVVRTVRTGRTVFPCLRFVAVDSGAPNAVLVEVRKYVPVVGILVLMLITIVWLSVTVTI